jgi:exodeoxyribonuclease-3
MRERNIGWRLDYVLASESLAASAASCVAYREIGTSDHAPVVATFDIDPAAAVRSAYEPGVPPV